MFLVFFYFQLLFVLNVSTQCYQLIWDLTEDLISSH